MSITSQDIPISDLDLTTTTNVYSNTLPKKQNKFIWLIILLILVIIIGWLYYTGAFNFSMSDMWSWVIIVLFAAIAILTVKYAVEQNL